MQIIWIFSDVTANNYTGIVLPELREITGYLLLFRVNGLKTLGQIFPNLRVIRARDLFFGSGLIIYEVDDIQSISLRKLSYLGHGVIASNNPQLCFLNMPDWSVIIPVSSKPRIIEERNGGQDGCKLIEGCYMACGNSQNSDHGGHCWDMDNCQEGSRPVVKVCGRPTLPTPTPICLVAMSNLW